MFLVAMYAEIFNQIQGNSLKNTQLPFVEKRNGRLGKEEALEERSRFQMGQMLCSSGSLKTYESTNFRVSVLTLLFLLFHSGTWPIQVGAISSATESPLNLHTAASPIQVGAHFPLPNLVPLGDELLGSERDVLSSSSLTNNLTPFESKSKANGQFARSVPTDGKSTTIAAPVSDSNPSNWDKVTMNLVPLYRAPSLSSYGRPSLDLNAMTPVTLRSSMIISPEEQPMFQSEAPLPPVDPLMEYLDAKSLVKEQQPLERNRGKRHEKEVSPSTTFSGSGTTTSSSYSSINYSEEDREKPSNINLLRKLWSSTRSSKLNLTHEHQSLLRIESEKSNTSSSTSSSTLSSSSTPNDIKSTTTSNVLGRSSNSSSKSFLDLSPEPETLGGVFSTYSANIGESPNPVDAVSSSSSTLLQLPTSQEVISLRPTSLKLDLESFKPAMIQSSSRSFDPSMADGYSIRTPTSFHSPIELSTSAPPNAFSNRENTNARENTFPKPLLFGRRRPSMMLYPEWLSSSGGVYPDDNSNATGEYYGEPEYENLISSNENNNGRSGNPGEREEEYPVRRMPFRKRINAEFMERLSNQSWQNRLRLREQQVILEAERESGSMNEEESSRGSAGGLVGSGNVMNSGIVAGSTERPEAIISQNGLADVISRGRIDSVMYVYFGDKYNDYHKEEIAGRIIQAVGGVIAAIAQVLTVLGAAKCVRKSSHSNQPPVHLHIGFALLISNLLLLLAVHATEPADVCATVAMILHYLHLVIGCWLFAHTVRTYFKLRRHAEAPNLVSSGPEDRPSEVKQNILSNSIRYSFSAWTAPLPFIIMSYLANPDGYETRHYCWMSIEKGMVVSFIVPVFLLIGWNTFLVVLSLRHLLAQRKLWADSSSAEMDEDSLDERKISSGIRASAMLLPLLAIMWFLGVVALENASSIFFQIAAASANIALSWLVLYFLGDEAWPELWCLWSKRNRANSSFSIEDSCSGVSSSVQPGAHLSFDNEPLLLATSLTQSLPIPSTSAALKAQDFGNASTSILTNSTGSIIKPVIPAIPGPSRTGKRSQKSMKKPNWTTPGGNEIYELKLDSISTICK